MGLFGEIKCRRCDRRYSAIRSRCPYCGARKKRAGKSDGDGDGKGKIIIGIILLAIIIIAVAVLVYMSLSGKTFGKSSPTPTPTAASTPKTSATPSPKASTTPTPAPTPTQTPVPSAAVTSITLSRTDFTLASIGETWVLYATLTPSNTTQTVKWTSDDPKIATVSTTGLVTAVGSGTTKITAEAGSVKAECVVRVTGSGSAPASTSSDASFKLSHSDVTISASKKETFNLTVSGSSETPTYRSDNANIASVSSSGTVTAVSVGTTRIYVTVGGKTLECIVRVI